MISQTKSPYDEWLAEGARRFAIELEILASRPWYKRIVWRLSPPQIELMDGALCVPNYMMRHWNSPVAVQIRTAYRKVFGKEYCIPQAGL